MTARVSFVADRLETTPLRGSAERLALVDLCALPRFGLKGAGTTDWAAAQGVVVPERPNLAAVQPGGGLALRLAAQELLFLGDVRGAGDLPDRLETAWPAGQGRRGWPMPRAHSHAWFALAGPHAPDALAAICAVDLRPHRFPELAIAQTEALGLTMIVLRAPFRAPLYHLLVDSAAAGYAWDGILDVMAEHDGAAAGPESLL